MPNQIPVPAVSKEQVAEEQKVATGRYEASGGSGDTYKADPNYHKMADFLGLQQQDRIDSDMANKIAFIRDATKETDELDAMVKIRDMIKQLGVSYQGKELVNKLYQYTRLSANMETIQKEMSLLVEDTNVSKS